MSKRIKSSDVQLGESFIIGQVFKSSFEGDFNDDAELSREELYSQLKENEFKQKLDLMLAESQQQSASIIAEAENKAAQLSKESELLAVKRQEEFEIFKTAVSEEAKKEGFKLGYEEGHQKAYEDVHLRVINLEAIAGTAFKLKKEIILSAEQEILQLSISVAEKILKQQLEIKPEMILEIIRVAINELKDKEEIKIIINPALKEQLYTFSEELKTSIKGMKIIKITEDRTIHPDSAIIESPESRIDVRFDTQIAEITREIMKTFAEEPVLGEIYES